jgi:hypothetical protein
LRFWLAIEWSGRVHDGLSKPSTDRGFVHINSLEFIILILEVATAIIRLGDLPNDIRMRIFRNGITSKFPVVQILSDNTAALEWEQKLSVMACSPAKTNLILVYAELLRSTQISFNSTHIAEVNNTIADFLSRPPSPTSSHNSQSCCSARLLQIFQQYSWLQTWTYFHPSRELLRLLSSLLFNAPRQARPVLPTKLGRFARDASTTSSMPFI